MNYLQRMKDALEGLSGAGNGRKSKAEAAFDLGRAFNDMTKALGFEVLECQIVGNTPDLRLHIETTSADHMAQILNVFRIAGAPEIGTVDAVTEGQTTIFVVEVVAKHGFF